MKKRFYFFAAVGMISILSTGCGTVDTRSTVEQMTNARVAVETAEKMDAKAYASQDLRHAQDALAIARDAYANQAFERAFDFSKKATIYALVAKAKTEQKKSEEKLVEVKQQLAKVRALTETYMKPAVPTMSVVPTVPVVPASQTNPASSSGQPTPTATTPVEVKP
ncbi:DUF4398 domain-containing protein [bacterium]|nr:DUF4398 domain-containing protein [bacterium]